MKVRVLVRGTQRAFTLIEVLVVLTIVGILAAIAIPNYSAYIQRGHRADAKAMLLLVAQWQERIRRETNNYSTALPAGMGQVPAPPSAARYTIAVTSPTARGPLTYDIRATRTGAQAGDECGNFVINELGGRTLESNTASMELCWGR